MSYCLKIARQHLEDAKKADRFAPRMEHLLWAAFHVGQAWTSESGNPGNDGDEEWLTWKAIQDELALEFKR